MKFVFDFLSRRTEIYAILTAFILITLGINLITISIFENFVLSNKAEILMISGFAIVGLSIVYLILKILWKKSIKKEFSGFTAISYDDNFPVDCDGYHFSEELRRIFEAGFAEDYTLKNIWNNDTIPIGEKDSLIIEAIEYFLIDEFSMHVSDYFNIMGLDKKQLLEFSRIDIPDILHSNRFLELFSRPFEQRDGFKKHIEDNETQYRVFGCMGINGELFREFHLVLPKGSKMSKSENSIAIETKRFTICIKVDHEMYATNLPRGFEKYYLRSYRYGGVSFSGINIYVTINYKFRSLFLRNCWEYYGWIDYFLEEFEKNFSKAYYFNSINWKQVYTQTVIDNSKFPSL